MLASLFILLFYSAAVQVKKKPLSVRIAEKEAKRKAELEEKRRKEEEARRELTAQEIAEQKLRQRQIEEESDFKLAQEAFGLTFDLLKRLA